VVNSSSTSWTGGKIRVVLAKLSVDKHIRALQVVAQVLRDGGMEVVFMGWGMIPEHIVDVAIQESADIIALSTHDNFHKILFPKVVQLLKDRGASNIRLVAGGIIPEKDKPFLESLGITGNFGPGTPGQVIVDHIRKIVTMGTA